MKKIISVLAVLSAAVFLLSACGKSEEVKACQDKIDAIGEVSLDKLQLIEDAEKAFALLSGDDKGDVKNRDELTSARTEYDTLKKFEDDVLALSDKLDRMLVENGISYKEVTDEYTALKEAIPQEKAEKYSSISVIEEKFEGLDAIKEKAEKSAVSYVKGFLSVNEGKDVTITEIGCIAQQSDGETYFMFALKYTEGSEEKSCYAKARYANVPAVESMTAYADNFYSEQPASEKTDALLMNNIIVDLEKILSEANV